MCKTMHGGAKHFEETANLWVEGGLRIGAVPFTAGLHSRNQSHGWKIHQLDDLPATNLHLVRGFFRSLCLTGGYIHIAGSARAERQSAKEPIEGLHDRPGHSGFGHGSNLRIPQPCSIAPRVPELVSRWMVVGKDGRRFRSSLLQHGDLCPSWHSPN